MSTWYKDGLNFSCTRCDKCCRHEPGYVFLSQRDLDRLCFGLGLSEEEFRKKYTRVVNFSLGSRLSLIEKPNYDCIFWKDGCTVYEHRPTQCRAFPFWPSVMANKADWEETAQNCPGMNKGKIHVESDIESWLSLRRSEPFLEG